MRLSQESSTDILSGRVVKNPIVLLKKEALLRMFRLLFAPTLPTTAAELEGEVAETMR